MIGDIEAKDPGASALLKNLVSRFFRPFGIAPVMHHDGESIFRHAACNRPAYALAGTRYQNRTFQFWLHNGFSIGGNSPGPGR